MVYAEELKQLPTIRIFISYGMHDVSTGSGIFGKSEMFGMYRISETPVYAYVHKREPGSQEGLLPRSSSSSSNTSTSSYS